MSIRKIGGALICSLLVATAAAQTGETLLPIEQFTFEGKGNYHGRPDPRQLLQITHPLAPAKEGDRGVFKGEFTIPEGAAPPYFISFYYNDNNEASGLQWANQVASRHGTLGGIVDERVGHRKAKVWIDGVEIWSEDTIESNHDQLRKVDITQWVEKGKPFNLQFGLSEIVDSSVRLPGDIQNVTQGELSNFKVNFERYETRSYWGDFRTHWGGSHQARTTASWPCTIALRKPVIPAPLPATGAGRLKVEKAELLQSRWAWPVVMGIPFGEGTTSEFPALLLNGTAIPHSFSLLNRWKDGSIKWGLLQFTLQPGPKAKEFRLSGQKGEKDKGPSEKVTSRIEKQSARMENGLLKVGLKPHRSTPGLTIAQGDRNLLNQFELYGRIGGESLQVTWDGIRAGEASEWQSEASVTGEMHFPNGKKFGRCRIDVTIFANVPYARLLVSLVNQAEGQTPLEQYGLRFQTASGAPGASGEDWAVVPDESGSVVLAARYYAHLKPNALHRTASGIDLEFLQEASQREPGQEIISSRGEMFLHEIWIALTPDSVSAEEAQAFAAMVETPPRLDSSALIRDSRVWGVMPKIDAEDRLAIAVIEKSLYPHFANPTTGLRAYGNYAGGILPNFYWNAIHTLYTLYAMTGERHWFDWAERSVRHQMSTLINHEPDGDRSPGGVKYRIDYTGRPEFNGKTQTTDGLFDHWQMTGDTAGKKLAIGLADFLAGDEKIRKSSRGLSSREQGWPILFLLRAYRETGEQRFLDEARELVQVGVSHIDNRRGAYIQKHGNESFKGIVPFMSGILMSALREFHLETHDTAAGEALVKSAWALYAETHHPGTTRMAPAIDYEYSPNPSSGRVPRGTFNLGISANQAYGSLIADDQALADIAVRTWDGFLKSKPVEYTPALCYDIPAALYWVQQAERQKPHLSAEHGSVLKPEVTNRRESAGH